MFAVHAAWSDNKTKGTMFLKWLRLGKSGIRCFRRTMWPRTDQHASRKSSPVLSNLRRGKLKYTSQGSSASNPSTSQELIDYGRLRIPNRMIFQSKTLYCRFVQFPCKKCNIIQITGRRGGSFLIKKNYCRYSLQNGMIFNFQFQNFPL